MGTWKGTGRDGEGWGRDCEGMVSGDGVPRYEKVQGVEVLTEAHWGGWWSWSRCTPAWGKSSTDAWPNARAPKKNTKAVSDFCKCTAWMASCPTSKREQMSQVAEATDVYGALEPPAAAATESECNCSLWAWRGVATSSAGPRPVPSILQPRPKRPAWLVFVRGGLKKKKAECVSHAARVESIARKTRFAGGSPSRWPKGKQRQGLTGWMALISRGA